MFPPVNAGVWRFFVAARGVVPALALLLLFDRSALAVSPWNLLINTNNIVTITNYGALGDGVFTNTLAISNAITAAAAGAVTNGLSGGTVRIPAGTYLSGPFLLKSAVNLQLDAGAILRMLPFGKYPLTYFTNVTTTYATNNSIVTTNRSTNVTWTAANFISGSSLHDIAISGAGAIDGQGSPWWPYANTNGDTRPIMIRLTSCNRELIQGVTLSNSPMFHISISGSSAANTTVQGVTIRANPSSDPVHPGHNTDACDVSGTNILVQNCDISVGDDNFTCGGNTAYILITNNTYGYGHGVSIGSYTSPSVSNMTVVNCTFNNTDQGIRIKTDRDRGGYVRNINYYNLSMTNVMRAILIYCQYTNTTSAYRAVDSISPGVAASYPTAPVTATTPRYRDITISNVTATGQSGRATGLIWGLPESCISNLTLIKVNLSADTKTFGIYDARNVRIIDCSHTSPAGVSQFSFYNTQVVFSNSAPGGSPVTLDGLASNSVANNFSFYNFLPTLKNTNALNFGTPVTLGSAVFTVSNHLALSGSNTLNFMLGTNAATMAVKGNLILGGTNNVTAGGGFADGRYTLMTYAGTLGGPLPTLGFAPPGFNYAFDTNTAGQVNLVVSLLAPTNLVALGTNLQIYLKWNAVNGASAYNLKRGTSIGGPYPTMFNGLTATNYADATVTNAVNYFYVVSAVGAGSESSNSLSATAQPLPSSQPASISMQVVGDQLQLAWPQDHLGWRLQMQTNDLVSGLGTNWVTVPNSTNVMGADIAISPTNSSVFLRLVYP